jgi:gamma-glutamylcyclotransferase (GGCT)/AIG2-like uncharacterized protein YtfP
MEFIFVYGTLRKASATTMSHTLTAHCEYVADGYMQGKMYEINGYPAAIESNNSKDKVYGETYRIVNNQLLFQLDEYEECSNQFPEPHEYIRKKLPIKLADNRKISAWVYIFNRDVANLRQINSGDYVSDMKVQDR